MSPKNKKLLLGGITIALVIAILAPFLASSNPDGLDSTMEKVMQSPETEPAIESPLPDYTIPFLGEDNPLGGVIALVLGTLLVLGIAYGLGAIIKKKNGEENT
ncbi:PDGLE domain-containing protein [Methanobacterium sp. ACI-7]|uniref:PDGLE domain-containing protein n=1 Tax=unclassified Methanobacterium TaxID=2627676 RepID=UPI0039C24A96